MENPKLIPVPFAKNGDKNTIPEKYNSTLEANKATWDTGFGRITMIPAPAGGMPPLGQDFNGVLHDLSDNIVYLSKGGRYKFSVEYASTIGGYSKGVILQSDDETKEFQSLIDNNIVNFNTASNADLVKSWKQISSSDILDQINSKQPSGSYATKAELKTVEGKIPSLMTEEELKEGESTEARAVSAQQLKSIIPPLMTEKELALGTSTEAKTVNAELLTSAFQKKIDSFAILYPNGGTAESPANISSNNRYVLENPFAGSNVMCLAEIQLNGEWGNPEMIFVTETGSTPGGRGVAANQLGDTIIVQSGSLGVCAYSTSSGNPFGATRNYTTAPVRVLVWRV